MAVLQPLYLTTGKYTASVERKLITALLDSDTNGLRDGGVFGPSSRMQVSFSGSTLSVSPGFCVIPDSDTPVNTSPGVYLAAIDGSSETFSLTQLSLPTSGTRVDLVYASVSEDSFVITSKQLSSNTATITTATNHGFSLGQTVHVSGVDDTFDGYYPITAVTTSAPYTFSYARTYSGTISATSVLPTAQVGNQAANITAYSLTSNTLSLTTAAQSPAFAVQDMVTIKGVSNALDGVYEVMGATGTTGPVTVGKIAANISNTTGPLSSAAKASVPFAIKIAQGTTTLPSGKNIRLATITLNTTTVTNVTDLRQFVSATGGVHVWDSGLNPTGPTGNPGRLRFNATTGATNAQKLEIYDSVSGSYKQIYSNLTGHHDTVATDGSAAAIHHTLGTGPSQAAAGNHSHTTLNGKTFFIQPASAGTPTANAVGDVWISY